MGTLQGWSEVRQWLRRERQAGLRKTGDSAPNRDNPAGVGD